MEKDPRQTVCARLRKRGEALLAGRQTILWYQVLGEQEEGGRDGWTELQENKEEDQLFLRACRQPSLEVEARREVG